MRARVYKLDDGTMDVFLEPSAGKGLPPVLLKGVTPEDVASRVLPVIEGMRQGRPTSQEVPRPG